MAHEIREQAAAWAARTGDPLFEDWDAFTAWLEQDPANARAYDEVSFAAAEAAEVLAVMPIAANDADARSHLASHPRRHRRLFGSALASFVAPSAAVAAAVAVVLALGVWQLRDNSYTIETAPGEIRLVELDGGGQIALAGGSRIALDRSDPRIASLEHGQALFTVNHDPAAPFRLAVGEDRLMNVGTVFDVTLTAERMFVAVAEGAVVFNPGADDVRLDAGQSLTSAVGSDRYQLGSVPSDEVGEWRGGRMTFRGADLGEVAAGLSRATGVRFAAAPGAVERSVSGSLLLDEVAADPRRLGPLLGVSVRYRADVWELGTP